MRSAVRRIAAGAAVAAAMTMGTGGAAWAQTGGQRLTMIFTTVNGVDQPTRAVATGPITGAGTETQAVDESSGVGQLTLMLGRGTVSGTFVETDFRFNFDPGSCTAKPASAGTIELTGGTGAFAGAHGTLPFTTRGTIIGSRGARGECLGPDDGVPPRVVFVIVEAAGTASVFPGL